MKKLKFLVLVLAFFSFGAMMPGPRHTCLDGKTEEYQSNGFFACGDKKVTSAKLNDIRRALSPNGYERVVFDLENMAGVDSAIPYFQVQIAPENGNIVVSIWTEVQYNFSIKKVKRSFSKSRAIQKLNVIPRVEEGLATFELKLKKKGASPRTEAFYLTNPPRIILDIL